MITRRVVLIVSMFASFATACTAIVAAQLGGKDDLPRVDSLSSSSGSPSEPVDKCSLAKIDSFSSSHFEPDAAHPCLECIQDNCVSELNYACDGGTNPPNEKEWFRTMKACAQNPEVGFGYSSWGCSTYARDASITTGPTEAAKESAAYLCVRTNCLQGDLPACATCPVYVPEPGSSSFSSRVPIEHSTCGQCMQKATGCAAELVKCCNAKVVRDHVAYCAFVGENGDYEAKCKDLRDGGISPPVDDDEDVQCDYEIRRCYKTKCQGSCP